MLSTAALFVDGVDGVNATFFKREREDVRLTGDRFTGVLAAFGSVFWMWGSSNFSNQLAKGPEPSLLKLLR